MAKKQNLAPEMYEPEYPEDLVGDESPAIPDVDLGATSSPFTKEELRNVFSLRNTYFQQKLLDSIDAADLYQATKRALRTVVNNYFSQNWMLTNLQPKMGRLADPEKIGHAIDDVKSAKLTLKLNLLKSRAVMCRSDRQSPDLLTIEDAIWSHFKAVANRATGRDRERILQSRSKVVQESITRNVEERVPQIKERKGLLSR